MLLATACWPCLLQDVLNRRLLFKTNRSSSTKGNHHPSFLRFLKLGRRKTVDAAKVRGGAENVVKTETQQTFVNGLLGFITLGIYTSAGSVCIAHTLHERLSIWATLSDCSLIYFWVPSSCFCIVISLSEGEIIPFSGVRQSGEAGQTSTPEAVVASRTDRWLLLWCATDDDQRQHHHAEHHFQL